MNLLTVVIQYMQTSAKPLSSTPKIIPTHLTSKVVGGASCGSAQTKIISDLKNISHLDYEQITKDI